MFLIQQYWRLPDKGTSFAEERFSLGPSPTLVVGRKVFNFRIGLPLARDLRGVE